MSSMRELGPRPPVTPPTGNSGAALGLRLLIGTGDPVPSVVLFIYPLGAQPGSFIEEMEWKELDMEMSAELSS